MPYIPHTDADIEAMLATIGVGSIHELFDEIPESLRCAALEKLPSALNEMEISRLMQERAKMDADTLCFIGAGAYEHHIPAAVWELTTRGEFYSAYTPYQAEASQGTLQLLYEYQSMMTQLTAMDASNASLYDGASALAEAVLMAVRSNRKAKSKKILLPKTLHPVYRQVVKTLVGNQGIELLELPYDQETGQTPLSALEAYVDESVAAVVIPQPNFFGVLEEHDAWVDWAHANNALAIALVNPLSLALLTPPGEWGEKGADIVCGEGQPLGIPLSSGGPYFGFMCCKKEHVRQMPGRIIGRTVDMDGKTGYTLTLQAREQHIRRSKATSNICTNQGLMVTAATIHMSLMGFTGLQQTAQACHANTRQLLDALCTLPQVKRLFPESAFFHEGVIQLPVPVSEVLRGLAEQRILGGYDLSPHYPELGQALLVCATEVRSEADIQRYVHTLEQVLIQLSTRSAA